MNVTQADIDALRDEWTKVVDDCESYFGRIQSVISKAVETGDRMAKYKRTIWPDFVSDDDKQNFVPQVSNRIARLVRHILETSQSSPLVQCYINR